MNVNIEEFEKFYRRTVGDSRKNYLKTDYYKFIVEQTSFLDEVYDDVKLWQRRYHIINNIDHILLCPICGKPIGRKVSRVGYISTCENKECIGKKRSESKKRSDLKKYGTSNFFETEEYKSKSKKTCLERYGVEYHSQTEERRKLSSEVDHSPELYEKIKQSQIKKYGDLYVNTKEYKNRFKKTCLERYGVDHISKSKEIQERIKETTKERYGSQYYFQTDDFKEKAKNTIVERYGADHFAKSDDYVAMMEEKFKVKLVNEPDLEYIGYVGEECHKLKCKKCGEEFVIKNQTFLTRQEGFRTICTNCNPLKKEWSEGEKELLDYVKSIYSGEIEENSKGLINPYEIDIYLPEINIAIEYNGLFWHSDFNQPNNYHKMKSDMCKKKGVHLIHIFEDDWKYKQDICKSVLSNFINQSNQISVYARKCKIDEVDYKEMNEFLVNNHMLGTVFASSKCYGLYFNNELISLMSFYLKSKNTKEYELNRYAIKCNYRIIGGAERLFRHFIKNVDYSSIITYNDNSIFKGRIYERLGFSYIRTNDPNFMYVNNYNTDRRFSKQSIRKLKMGYTKEIEKELKLLRVYNAGNDVYEFKKENLSSSF